MSFLKRSDLEAKNVIHFNLCYQRDKVRTIIFNKQISKTKLLDGFLCIWKSKLKTNSNRKQKSPRQKFKNQFHASYAESFQLSNTVQIFKIHPLVLAQETLLKSKKNLFSFQSVQLEFSGKGRQGW